MASRSRSWWSFLIVLMLAGLGVATLWLVGVTFAAAQVWVEAPWR